MALGIELKDDLKNISLGPVPTSFAVITGDAAYPTGGYPVTGQMVSLRGITGIAMAGGNSMALGYTLYWNTETETLQVVAPGGTELTSGSNITANSWTVFIFGQR